MENLYRGDYLPFKLQIKNDDGTIRHSEVDEVIFWLKENKYSSKPLIEKKMSAEEITFDKRNYNYSFVLLPDETKNFDYEKRYFFAVKVFVNGQPYTILNGTMTFDWEGVFVYKMGDKNE